MLKIVRGQKIPFEGFFRERNDSLVSISSVQFTSIQACKIDLHDLHCFNACKSSQNVWQTNVVETFRLKTFGFVV